MVDLAVDGRAELLSELDMFSSKWSKLNLFSRCVHMGKRVSGEGVGGTVNELDMFRDVVKIEL